MDASCESVISCLFCVSECSGSSGIELEMAGAVYCEKLKKQLQNLFVLRNILDLDLNWCANMLQARATEDLLNSHVKIEDSQSCTTPKPRGDLEHWFQLCQRCMETVAQAWKVHQRLLSAQIRMDQIKEEMKRRMRDNWVPGDREVVNFEDQIRKLVCTGNVEISESVLPNDLEVLPDFPLVFEDDFAMPQLVKMDIGNVEPDIAVPPKKRKRGRPFGSRTKNRETLEPKDGVTKYREHFETVNQSGVDGPFPESRDETGHPVTIDFQDREIEDPSDPAFIIDESSNSNSLPSPSDASSSSVDPELLDDASSSSSSIISCYSEPRSPAPGEKRKPGRPVGSGRRSTSTFPVKRKPGRPFGSVTRKPGRPFGSVTRKPGRPFGSHGRRGRPPGSGVGKVYKPGQRRPGRPPRPKSSSDPPKKRPRNYKRKHEWVDCPHCDSRFKLTDKERFDRHLSLHAKSEAAGGGEFDCPQCNFPAQDCLELDLHFRLRHIYTMVNNKIWHECPKCDFKSRIFKRLREHASLEHGGMTDEELGRSQNFDCPNCSRKFINGRALQAHKKAFHPEIFGIEEEEVGCSKCDLKFPSKLALQAHINNYHSTNQRFQCDSCGRGYEHMSQLKRHKLSHTRLTKREHVCPVCHVDYAHKEILMKHIRHFHPDTEANVGPSAEAAEEALLTCRYCPFKTSFRPVLIKHLKEHKESMGNKCTKCAKCYTSAQGLQRHLRINHSEIQVPCPYCNRKYASVEYMKDHLKKFCKMKNLKERSVQAQGAILDEALTTRPAPEENKPDESRPVLIVPPSYEHKLTEGVNEGNANVSIIANLNYGFSLVKNPETG